jgi:putative transposase
MTQRAYKYRFYPNKTQAEMLEQTFGCVRFVYNRTLAYSQEQYQQGNKTYFSDWNKNLTDLKKATEFEWLKAVSSVPLQQTLRHLDKAFKAFFKSGFGYPKFKSKRHKQSACYMQTALSGTLKSKCSLWRRWIAHSTSNGHATLPESQPRLTCPKQALANISSAYW